MNRSLQLMGPTRRFQRHALGGAVAACLFAAGCSGSADEVQPRPTRAASTSMPTPIGAPSTRRSSTAPTKAPPTTPSVPAPTFLDASGFDDHTVPRIALGT